MAVFLWRSAGTGGQRPALSGREWHRVRLRRMSETTRNIVVIGASAGGVQALQALVEKLPPDFPATICVVLHIWPGGESYLAPILSRAGPLPASQPSDGDPVRTGQIYVAPRDCHLLLEEGKIAVVRGPRENRFRPAINPLFRSAAAAYRSRVIGVILTGMLDDGAAGLWAIKRCGGVAVVQSDADFDQMPNAALQNVEVDHLVPLAEIPGLLDRLVRERIVADQKREVPELIRTNLEGSRVHALKSSPAESGQLSGLSCPECSGALWEVEEGQTQYRCHVGHAYSPNGLREAQGANVEESLWSALRALKESAALDSRLAERSQAHNLASAAALYSKSAHQKQSQAKQVQEFLRQLRVDPDANGKKRTVDGP